MDRAQAEKAIREGSNVGFFSAGVAFLMGVFTVLFGAGDLAAFGFDGWLILDAFLGAGLAYGIRRGYPVAAVGLFLYFLAGKVSIALSAGRVPGLVIALIFLWYFGKAVQGTVALRRIRREEDPDYSPPRAWVTVVSAGALAVLLAALAFGAMIESGAFPDTAVVTGDELNEGVSEFLRDQGMIDEGEEILLFYSAALVSFAKDGSVLTDRRVLSYEETDGELWFASLGYEEIAEVEVQEPGGTLSEAVVAVYDEEGERFRMYVHRSWRVTAVPRHAGGSPESGARPLSGEKTRGVTHQN